MWDIKIAAAELTRYMWWSIEFCQADRLLGLLEEVQDSKVEVSRVGIRERLLGGTVGAMIRLVNLGLKMMVLGFICTCIWHASVRMVVQ